VLYVNGRRVHDRDSGWRGNGAGPYDGALFVRAYPNIPRGSFVRIGWHRAVRGEISANGQQIDTLLSRGSFNKTLEEQIAYAQELGYRLATREEHEAYVNGLLEKEADGSINKAEFNALKIYRARFVRDTKGVLYVNGRRVHDRDSGWRGNGAGPYDGALFVRAYPNIPRGNLQVIDGYQAVEV
jgi:hypothetical protein